MGKNMKQFLISLIIIIIVFFSFAVKVHAALLESDPEANLTATEPVVDERADKLKSYLLAHGSPIADKAAVFISEADKNNLDWKMVVAISGLESTFCQHIPTGSYNCWGWGIPTGAQSGIGFKDYRDGIAQVSQGLRNNYLNKGYITVEQIGSVYAASPTWACRVRNIMKDIDDWNLPLTSVVELKITI
jgi:hypothetical protein